ncbi:MAG: YggS family pyridoxal phosphate-dependent enzyme [Candidatus Nanopelagicaceae bacterium]|nr:YggS family pyridoxal phosphate-dependent enzyme [Candidatus Nanopelagicaceae bacterium]
MSNSARESRKLEISSALTRIRSDIPDSATLIVVTKTFPVSDVEILYELGERNFGENRDEEGSEKSKAVPEDVIWHFQGNIQSNKIRSIIGWADFIHSLDNQSHAKKINEVASSLGKSQQVFLQVNLDSGTGNENRSGIDPKNFEEFSDFLLSLKNVELAGVMGVAPLGIDPAPGFELLYELSLRLRTKKSSASFISAGMSGDYPIALRYGATHIRIGSSILGSR